MPAAGAGLLSTVTDLSTLLAVAMDYERSPLGAALTAAVTTRRPIAPGGDEQAPGWTVIGKGNGQLVLRDDGTLDAALLDTYVGRYEAAGEGVFSIILESDQLLNVRVKSGHCQLIS